MLGHERSHGSEAFVAALTCNHRIIGHFDKDELLSEVTSGAKSEFLDNVIDVKKAMRYARDAVNVTEPAGPSLTWFSLVFICAHCFSLVFIFFAVVFY